LSERYNQDYYEQYDMGGRKVDYQSSRALQDFLAGVADRIVADFHPQTVLDAGCATGHLVAALRDRGVQAWGIDISSFAIGQTRPDIRPYCRVSSLTGALPADFPQHFDLVTCLEVLEHLYEEDLTPALDNLCRHTDRVLFSSSSTDFEEPTHLNVQRAPYWLKRFAARGFFREPGHDTGYIADSACLVRTADVARVVEEYERRQMRDAERLSRNGFAGPLRACAYFDTGSGFTPESKLVFELEGAEFRQTVELPQGTKSLRFDPAEGLGCAVRGLQALSDRGPLDAHNANGIHLDAFDIFAHADPQFVIDLGREPARWVQLSAQILPLYESEFYPLFGRFAEIKQLSRQLDESGAQNEALRLRLEEAESALAKTAKGRDDSERAYRAVLASTSWRITAPARYVVDAVKSFMKSHRATALVLRGLSSLRRDGVGVTARRVLKWLRQKTRCQNYMAANALSPEERARQRDTVFKRPVKISVLVPLYNTPVRFLKQMIRSVQAQSYENWELCLADGSDARHGAVGRICRDFAARDGRIRYQKLEQNLGISGNSNRCIEMATGDYLALFDHDDLLHPAALFEVVKAVCHQGADFVYTDELTFGRSLRHIVTAHFKPDFSPDTLRSYNYICHLCVFARALLNEAGAFDSACDGSQDYDLILRLTERARNIVHIPKVLYYWRAHRRSTAANISAKPYTMAAARRALGAHLARLGLEGRAEDAAVPTTYRIRYTLRENPLVSILIPNKDHPELLRRCIDSIREKSTYRHYEIIVIENNSVQKETFDLYESLSRQENIRICTWQGPFNYAAINNFGFGHAGGEYVLLLNNDIEVISPGWLEEMLMFAQRPDVGAVGAMLYYPDDTIQHAGVIVGLGGVAGHSHKGFARGSRGYMARLTIVQNLSAVTAACMLLPRRVYEEMNGLDEGFAVAFNDVDLCLRIRKAGYRIVFTPYAELYHHESKTRGYEDTPEKVRRFEGEIRRFKDRWKDVLASGDPYYNPHLTLDREDFSFR
jgi:GT2 family glycosyltransferase/2-polyprenyl-3-methyl-5-hydroxy-6-metoxy-1,4-benzoquinol methylase